LISQKLVSALEDEVPASRDCAHGVQRENIGRCRHGILAPAFEDVCAWHVAKRVPRSTVQCCTCKKRDTSRPKH